MAHDVYLEMGIRARYCVLYVTAVGLFLALFPQRLIRLCRLVGVLICAPALGVFSGKRSALLAARYDEHIGDFSLAPNRGRHGRALFLRHMLEWSPLCLHSQPRSLAKSACCFLRHFHRQGFGSLAGRYLEPGRRRWLFPAYEPLRPAPRKVIRRVEIRRRGRPSACVASGFRVGALWYRLPE